LSQRAQKKHIYEARSPDVNVADNFFSRIAIPVIASNTMAGRIVEN
jgi:hypothetical protein